MQIFIRNGAFSADIWQGFIKHAIRSKEEKWQNQKLLLQFGVKTEKQTHVLSLHAHHSAWFFFWESIFKLPTYKELKIVFI